MLNSTAGLRILIAHQSHPAPKAARAHHIFVGSGQHRSGHSRVTGSAT